MYVTRFQDASFRALADFEEDVDVLTGSAEGVRLRGDSLATWREETLELRSSNRNDTPASQHNQGLVLGWNNRIAGEDTTRVGPPARYAIELPAGLAGEWRLDGAGSLQLSLAATERMPSPRRDPAADSAAEGSERGRRGGGGRRSAGSGDDDDKPPLNLSVELEDGRGRTASVSLADYGPIRRPLEIHVRRRTDLEASMQHWELVLQTFVIPLSDFTDAAEPPSLDDVRAVRLVFDRAVTGEVVVDEIGFSRLPPEFWSARIR
jgi:hypothetical protein